VVDAFEGAPYSHRDNHDQLGSSDDRKLRRRTTLAVLVAAGAVVVVAAVVVLLHHGSNQSRPRLPAVVSAVSKSPRVSPAIARATVQAFTTAGAPLATLRQVGSGLVAEHNAAQCASAEQKLSSAGTPTSLRETAAQLPDPLAADLAADLVTAEGEVLAGCKSGSRVASGTVAVLSDAVQGLDTRIKDDGGP